MNKKPTVEDILDLYHDCDNRYRESGLFTNFEQDEKYYELDFSSLLGIPREFSDQGIVLPTARDMVDTCVDYTDITNAVIKVNQRKGTKADKEIAEMLRKFGYGVLYRNNIESSIAPLRVSAKHYWLHGLAVVKTVWDADRYTDKPERKDGEDESNYAERIDKWRSEYHDSIPIVMQGINPACIMLDQAYDGGGFIFETREELVYNVKQKYPKWNNYKGKKITDKITHISYWDKDYRCELYDDEPVLKVKGGVGEHTYGFIPYTMIDSGLGNINKNNDLDKRYVGILRYMLGLLRSESRDYSLADILVSREILTGGFLVGDNAALVKEISVKYGEWNPLPEGVTLMPYEAKLPPQELQQHLGVSSDYISAHAAPRSTRGLSETGVRSGSDRRLIMSQAAQRYQYSNEAFKSGVAKVLSNCARIMKNVVPGDINVWAKTPTDEFDTEIKKDMLKEPFTFFVEFSNESPEDDYRKHDDLERMIQAKLVTTEWAREQLPNVDVAQMERQEQKALIRYSQAYQQILMQAAAGKLAQKLQGLQVAAQPPPPAQPAQPIPGNMTPGIPNVPVPGSPQMMQNQMRNMRSQVPMNPSQGRGGGGARYA
jgi:hypothetical protein